MHLAVSELFGPTIQGEGPALGQRAIFLRLMGCNLACSWCDTPYTWDATRYDLAKEGRRWPLADLADEVRAALSGPDGITPHQPTLLVITGGEPMLQQEKLLALLEHLPASQAVHIETAGTVAPRYPELDERVKYVVSLKLAHSGNGAQRHVSEAITALRDSGQVIAWKFVLQQPADYAEVDALVAIYGLQPVYVMPEGTDDEVLEARMRILAPAAIERGYLLTPRLHIELWGNTRGH